MQNILTNWKTSAAGALVIVLGILSMFGVHVPGFTDPGLTTDLVVGGGLIFAGDASKFGDVLSKLGMK